MKYNKMYIRKSVKQIWEEVLEIETLSITDKFFDIGGDSLNCLKLIFNIKQCFELELPISFIFSNPTIETMTVYLYQKMKDKDKNHA